MPTPHPLKLRGAGRRLSNFGKLLNRRGLEKFRLTGSRAAGGRRGVIFTGEVVAFS